MIYSGISEQKIPLQLFGQTAEFKCESTFEPLLVIWQSLPKAIPESRRQSKFSTAKSIAGLLARESWGAAPVLLRSQALLGRVGRASTNKGIPESAAVAAGRDHLACNHF